MYIVEPDTEEQCPYNQKCNFETVNDRVDRCTTCGQEITY